jgi:hypothetical protein
VRCAAHHTPAPVQITLRNALRTATIARLSLISRAAPSEREDEGHDCGNFLSGDVRVPASKAIMPYASGSSGGSSDLSALAPSFVRTHLEREERRVYEMVGVCVDELDVSDRSGDSSAERGAGIVCTRGRNFSARWGSSETRRMSGWDGPLIELRGGTRGTTSCCCTGNWSAEFRPGSAQITTDGLVQFTTGPPLIRYSITAIARKDKTEFVLLAPFPY